MTGGRPTKLTKEVAAAICADVEAGVALAHAARAAGVSKRTALGWLAAGRAAAEADEESPEREFAEGVDTARARLARDVALNLRAGTLDHRAAAYFEKTRFPDVYGEAALEAAVAAELAGDAPDADGQAEHGAAVRVELVRCFACGEDQLPGKRFCGDCKAELPRLEASTA